MKNLMIYISPTGSFTNPRPDLVADDSEVCAQIQIENCQHWGWKSEDLMLFTNFDYQHQQTRAAKLSNVDFFDRKPQASKINAILKLFDTGEIKDGEIYWFHDLDSFQILPTSDVIIDLDGYDMALSDYGVASRWSTGVIYFTSASRDIFEKVKAVTYRKNINEELALGILTSRDPELNKRIRKIPKSFNFTPRCLKSMYRQFPKIPILHFHPMGAAWRNGPDNALAFLRGENPLQTSIIPDYLLQIFEDHQLT